jgi:shikimate dehydrogenase
MTSRSYAEVIGDPIEQSLSPTIHGFWLQALGIEASYGRRHVTRAELPAYLSGRRVDEDWRGSNVTMPLKLDAVALADEATDRAVAAGAANVLMRRDGRLVAANTDVGAIAMLLARLYESKARMGSVTLLGNGGAARAALVALKLVGISAVRRRSPATASSMPRRSACRDRTVSTAISIGCPHLAGCSTWSPTRR